MSDQTPKPNALPHDPIQVKMPQRKPVMTIVLIAVTTLIYLLQFIFQGIYGFDLLFALAGKFNSAIANGQVWRLLTPVFLHSSILHIALNMYALYIIGRRLERFYGPWRFMILYFVSAFAGNVLSYVLTPAASLGASTAIFGLLAAEGVFIFENRKLFGPNRTRQMILNLGFILVINLSFGFMPNMNVDNMGHIGGLLGGIFFAWKAGPALRIKGQPPFFEVKDVRKQGEVILATLIVLIGFIIIAAIPFLTS
ncbi:rhomboid family intramembrane serine protease [bacterium]|nr:rhomboid family intramembrane serine protease [bacterium]